jgi:transcription initiation factor IIE alpha subunit
MSAIELIERLIATVTRAFYCDTTVMIMDALVREKFIREEEMGPRLKIPAKDARKIMAQMENEQLVSWEDLTMEDRRTSRCWYIDYNRFMHIVLYRVHLMKKELEDTEKLQNNRLFYHCTFCGEKYSELQVQQLVSKDMKFVCSHCAPNEFRHMPAEPRYTLKEYDNRAELSEIDAISRKIKDQLNASDIHDGLFDLLKALKDQPMIHNRPSENIVRGIGASRVTDEDTLREIEDNSTRFRGKARKDATGSVLDYMTTSGGGISVRIVGSEANNGFEDNTVGEEHPAKKQKQFPAHLLGSRVAGTANPLAVDGSGGLLNSTSAAAVPSASENIVRVPEAPVVESVAYANNAVESTIVKVKVEKKDIVMPVQEDVEWEE